MAALYPEDMVLSEDFLTCKICSKTLKNPKLLPCQHSFCKDCLIENMTLSYMDDNVTCPCCERIVKVKNGDIEQLSDNYLFPILQEQRAAPTDAIEYCLPCQYDKKETKASHKCLDCQDTFCINCKKFHKFTTQTRTHKVVKIKEIKKGRYKTEMKSKKIKICRQHSTTEREIPLDFFCEHCHCLVCNHCVTFEHKAHSCSLVDLVEEKERIQLGVTIKQLDDIQDKASRFFHELDNMSQSLKGERDEAENKVHQAADELYALVDKVKEDKLGEIKTHYEGELEKIEKEKERQKHQRKLTHTIKSFAEAFLSQSSKVDFMDHFKDVEFRVKDFVDRKEDACIKTGHLNIENRPCADGNRMVNEILGKVSVQKITLFETGERMKEFGEPRVMFDVETKIKEINGLTVTDDNDIIAVGGSEIGVFSNDGVHKKWIDCPELRSPHDVTIRGSILFVIGKAAWSRKVLVLDTSGALQRRIPMPRNEHGHFSSFRLAVDDTYTMFIASRETHTVYKCIFGSTIPKPFLTESTKPGLQFPRSLCVTPKQELVVSNYNNIQAYNENGELLWQYDGIEDLYREITPSEMCCDNVGRVYVCDMKNQIQVLKDGHFIGIVRLQGLSNVSHLAVNSRNELIMSTSRNNYATNTIKKIAIANNIKNKLR